MASKRQKKKQAKIRLKENLQNRGISKKETSSLSYNQLQERVKKENQAERKRERQRELYQIKKTIIRENGLNISPSASMKTINAAIEEKEAQRVKNQNRKLSKLQEKKRDWLRTYGLWNEDNPKWSVLNKSWNDIYSMRSQSFNDNDKVLSVSDWWIYIGYRDARGEADILRMQVYYSDYTDDELRFHIRERLNRYNGSWKDYDGTEGSPGRPGDTKYAIYHKSDLRVADWEIAENERKGFQTIFENKFTQHGALKLVLVMLDNLTQDRIKPFYTYVTKYFKKFHPKIWEAFEELE